MVVYLKDRSKTPTEDEREWYERAFGRKRNMQRYFVSYVPLFEIGKKGLCNFYVKFNYKPFPEMSEEFDLKEFDKYRDCWIKMRCDDDDPENRRYEWEVELPWGEFKYQYYYSHPQGGEAEEKILLPDNQRDTLKAKLEPESISAEQQRLLDQAEEEENKRREHEARMAQKKMEEEKARLKYEQQQLIAKQEQNTARLEVYLRAMNLGLHRSEEEFNASLSILSIFHLDLSDHFSFYASLQPQLFRKKQNELMPLQGFLHFLKVMRLASTREEALRLCEALHELIHVPLTDTLNIKNGINYAMFLECIIRIAYHRLEEGAGPDYKSVLEAMFSEGNIELKKRMMDDRLLSELYSHDNAKVFYEHSTLLQAVFSSKARVQHENFLELSKEDFMHILVDSGILSAAAGKEEESGGEIKRKFNGENVMAVIAGVGSFDSNYLTYVDFLDCLVRVANLYPFPDSGPQKA